MNTKTLTCPNCRGQMQFDDYNEVYECPFCGYKEKIEDSDQVRIEKIRANTQRDIELTRENNRVKAEKERKEEENIAAYKKGKLSKVTIAFAIICLFAMFAAFSQKHIIAGIIALVQTVLFSMSWLLGMHIIKEKFRSMHLILAIIGFVLIILFSLASAGSANRQDAKEHKKKLQNMESLAWPESELARKLPRPLSDKGEITLESDDYLNMDIYEIKESDFNNYISACKSKGFTVDYTSSSGFYSADNSDGDSLLIWYDADKECMTINLSKKVEKAQDESTPAEDKNIQVSKDDAADIPDEPDINPDESPADKAGDELLDGMRPEFKKSMDSYEEFFNEYADFMKKYIADPTNAISMIGEYTEMMVKYADYMEKMDALGEEDLNEAELKYYMEVTGRVNQKLLGVSSGQ